MTAAPVTPVRGVLADAAALVDLGARTCEAYGLPDLAARLTRRGQDLAGAAVHVLVVGDFKQGKSSLVNALVGAPVCPVDDNVATAVATYVRHGPRALAETIHNGSREPVGIDDLRRVVFEGTAGIGHDTGGAERLSGVEIQLPCDLLADGLILVDTPGVGGLGSAYAVSSLAAISLADAVLFVADAEEPLTRNEIGFLRHARTLCGTVACVLPKIDFYPGWRGVRDANEEQLGPDVPIFPVSVPLRARAVETGDAELSAESGFDALVRFLTNRVSGGAVRRLAGGAAAHVVAVCDQIAGQFEAERAALGDPAAASRVTGELTAAAKTIDRLRAEAAGWRQMLDEAGARLAADLDHDLRVRIDRVVAEAGQAIDDGDPADTWPQMPSWLQSRISPELIDNYALLCRRVNELAAAIEHLFQADALETPHRLAAVDFPTAALSEIRTAPPTGQERMRSGPAMAALKQAYGGVLGFTLFGGLTEVVLSPIDVGIALVMGHTGLRDEKERQQFHRRTQAKQAVRRYCDEVIVLAGRDSREALDVLQRQLREHLGALADELDRSNAMTLDAVRAAASRPEAVRKQRIADLDAELARLAELRRRATAMPASGDQTTGGGVVA